MGGGKKNRSPISEERAAQEVIHAVTVSRWLGTTIFDENFVQAWGDMDYRTVLVRAYADARDRSHERVVEKALIWNAQATSLLADGVLKFLGWKHKGTVEGLLNPFTEKRRVPKMTEAEKLAEVSKAWGFTIPSEKN